MSPIRIILDTDIGTDVDDAVALALLLASPELDVAAVTTVSGDVRLRARIAKKFLALGGRASVPVFAGESEPLRPHRSFLWLGHEGRGIVGEEERVAIEPRGAVEVLAHTDPADPTEIVAIGPLTNIARALNRHPDLREAIPRMTIMGGVLGPTREPAAAAFEYNFGSDAEASVAVLEAGIPTAIVPLDVTQRVFFRPHDLGRLRRSRSAVVQTLCDAMEIWWKLHREIFAGQPPYDADIVCFLHDPLALSLLVEPSLATLTPMRLVPEIDDGAFRLRRADDGHPFTVASSVDAAAFVEFVVERLLKLE